MPAIPDGVPLLDVTEYPDRVELVWRQFPKRHRRSECGGATRIIPVDGIPHGRVRSFQNPQRDVHESRYDSELYVPGTALAYDDKVVRIRRSQLPEGFLDSLIAWVRSEDGGVWHRIDHGGGLGGSTCTDGSYTKALPDVVAQELRATDPYVRIKHDSPNVHIAVETVFGTNATILHGNEGACRFHLPLPPSAFGADLSLDSVSLLHVIPDDDEEDTREHDLEMLDEIENTQRARLQRILKAWPRCERHNTPLQFYLSEKVDKKGLGRFFFTCPYGEDE